MEEEAITQIQELFEDSGISNIKNIIVKSVKEGYIDPPFAPHVNCLKSFKAIRALDSSLRVASDFPGKCSKKFIRHEREFLRDNINYSELSADEIKIQIKHPLEKDQEWK